MPSALAARRREIFAAARARADDFVRLDPTRLRFSLGTTPGDPRVPLLVAGDAAGLVRVAAADLALLLSTGHRAFVSADDVDRLQLSDGYAALPSPAPTLGPSGGGVDLRSAARLAAACHPALTGGILCAWMGPGGAGRSLTALWIELLRQALAEMAGSKDREETPLLVALALQGELLAAADAVLDRLPGPPHDRYLRSATGLGLWVAAQTGIARAWRHAGRPSGDPLLLRLEALVAPAPLCGRGSKLGGATLYGCALTAGLPRADAQVGRLAAGADPEAVAGDVAAALRSDEESLRRALLAAAVGRLRDLLVAGVVAAEGVGWGERLQAFRDVLAAPAGLEGTLGDEPARRDLRAAAAALQEVPGEAGQVFAEVTRALKGFRPRDPGASFGLPGEAACQEYAACAVTVACDAALERMLAPARRALALRTGQETEAGADAEWEAGRLYRLSARGGPILRQSRQRPVGHLFADVKDFTRRTGLLGQATMAEFLRSEFYRPILTAAKGFYGGMGHLADQGGVSLNNMLGDAVSFTGDIQALVALAREIRELLAGYGARLAREVSSEAVARQVRDIEEHHRAGSERVRLEAQRARQAVERNPPRSPRRAEAQAMLARCAAEQAALERDRERALARARGEGLEAGVFLSHGAAPLVVVIDDEVFGQNRVAIADKINESARGTARAPLARVRADAELEAERVARRRPALAHAFSVFVDHPLTVALSGEAERAALAAVRAGDPAGALEAVAGPVRAALEEAAAHLGEEPGEIYNGGAALSQEALDAFLAAVRPARRIREISLDPAAIPANLKDRWWFGARAEPAVVTFHPDGRPAELFRRVGYAAFKGMADVPVWELCTGPATELLLSALGPAWLRGA